MISVYQLQIFLSVVDKGSFSAAALELNMSQPAVSQHVRALEEQYKFKLFARYGQRIELTEAGYSLLEPARRLVNEAIQLDERFQAGAGELHGRITLTYSHSAAGALYLLPELLAHFHQKYQGVQFFLQSAPEEETVARLLEREIAFAVLSHIPRQKTLESYLLQRDHIVLALPSGHPWIGTKVALEKLKGEPFVLRRAGSETRRQLELALRAGGLSLSDLQIIAEVDSAEGVALAVEAGLGAGFLVSTIGQKFKRLGLAQLKLSQREVEAGADLSREIHLARMLPTPDRIPSPAQQRFWEDLGRM